MDIWLTLIPIFREERQEKDNSLNSKMIIDLRFSTIKEPLPGFIYKDLRSFSRKSNDYFPQPRVLIKLLSEKFETKKENIFLTAGSDEAILTLSKIYKKTVVVFTPTYMEYANKKIFGSNIIKINALTSTGYFIDPCYYPGASIIFIGNPNNPIGVVDKETIYELIKNNQKTIIVVDETYGEFFDNSVVKNVNKFNNLVVLRSFSKDYGMAGIRIGFMVANKEVIQRVKELTQLTNTSYLSVGAAISAISHEDYFIKLRSRVTKERDLFTRFLISNKLKVITSNINVVLLKFTNKKNSKKFYDFLKKHDIYTNLGNAGSNIGLDKSYVRIAIGTQKEMRIVKETIKKYISNN